MINKMLEESKMILNISDMAVQAYSKHAEEMLMHVNQSMKKEEDITRLLGNNPLSLMEMNHENHISFIKNVIKYKQNEVLLHTLPWVYKAYHSKGLEYDYFKIELEYWIHAIKVYVEDSLQDELIGIYRLMLKWHDALILLSEDDNIITYQPDILWTEDHDKIVKYLLSGDFRSLMLYAKKRLDTHVSVIDFYLGYFQPAMYKIGDLWENGVITVAHEHLATSTIARVMSSIYPDYVLGDLEKSVAIVSAGVNEYHQIGARMVADILEVDGWDVRFLGANVPIEQLVALVEELKPTFVSLSITMNFYLDDLVETIEKIRTASDVKIMIGGLAINNNKDLQHTLDADAFPLNARESRDIAREWWLNDA